MAAINKLNHGQIRVVTFDQPVYAIVEQFNGTGHGGDLFVIPCWVAFAQRCNPEDSSRFAAGQWLDIGINAC